MELNSKHQKTLDALFQNPIRSNIFWSDIESLLVALGAEVSDVEGQESDLLLMI
ncbi:hypothetical protein [Nostoc favosum]|uniref:hypothetical protein n=1 Tax=Nostoc favosum TaxID=2907819 RepID=UPI002795F7D3|nr:hypothetical protein [Nostoc favosum]